MIGVNQAFSASYAQARIKFLEAAARAGLPIQSHNLDLPGRDGETLAMDVVRDGPVDAERLLIVSSACHGAEGYCGSGVQVFALCDDEWRERAHAAGVAVVYIHALNPHGFSWGRRVTQENVDLNRNFRDFSQPQTDNPAYADLHDVLLPAQWPPSADNQAAIDSWIASHGMRAYQTAVSQGQCAYPQGMFFGGQAPTWSNRTLRAVLREHASRAKHIAWIDLHTGLGESGVGERIWAGRDDAQAIARARSWWDGGGATPVTSIYDGSSTSALLTGLMWESIHDECPQASYTGIAMEYGTVELSQVINCLRADHWLYLHPEASPELAACIKADLKAAFYVDSDAWRGQIVAQGRQSMFQAVQGLSQL